MTDRSVRKLVKIFDIDEYVLQEDLAEVLRKLYEGRKFENATNWVEFNTTIQKISIHDLNKFAAVDDFSILGTWLQHPVPDVEGCNNMQYEEDDQAEANMSAGAGNQVPEDPDAEEKLLVNLFHMVDAVYKMQPSKPMDNIIYPSIEDSFFLAYYSEVFDNCNDEPKKCCSVFDVLRSTDPLDDNSHAFLPPRVWSEAREC